MPMDRSKYPDNWKEISNAVRERAGQKCEECGAPNGVLVMRAPKSDAWREVDKIRGSDIGFYGSLGARIVKIVLTVSHTDHDTTNNERSNLRALCQLHHLRHDAAHHAKNAAETRRRRKIERGQTALPVGGEGGR